MPEPGGESPQPSEWGRRQAPWVKRLVMRGRGSFRLAVKRPLIVDVVMGSRPYINLSHGSRAGQEHYIVSLSPAEFRQMVQHVETALSGSSEQVES